MQFIAHIWLMAWWKKIMDNCDLFNEIVKKIFSGTPIQVNIYEEIYFNLLLPTEEILSS